jgi:hypothetical protein
MRQFKYETHAHTAEVSRCASISGKDIARFYKAKGYTGLIITDHFFNGNTLVPSNLSWEERVEWFCSGFENAYTEGEKIGLHVFFGWEYTYKGTDFLTYGLDKSWLLDHPDLLSLSLTDYCALVHRDGGFIIHAHPFRQADYINMIRLLPHKVDAVEVINVFNTDFENKQAEEYANNYDLYKIAGSDNHHGRIKKYSGIQFNKCVKDMYSLVWEIKYGEYSMFTEQE